MHSSESNKDPRLLRALAQKCEKGFTLMEILVALAIIGIIIAVTAAALGGRATTTRLQSVAQQVAQTVQGRQQLFLNDLRTNAITANELANELATTFSGSTMVTAVGDAAAACTAAGTTDLGLEFTVGTLDTDEAEALQALITTAVAGLFSTATPPAGNYQTVFGLTVDSTPRTGTAVRGATNVLVNLCIGD